MDREVMDQLDEVEQELKALRQEFEGYRRQKQEEESRRLRTALIAAGGVIVTLGGFVWWEIIWPAIDSIRNRP